MRATAITQRFRRLACLLFLVACLAVPMGLRVFWMENNPLATVSYHQQQLKFLLESQGGEGNSSNNNNVFVASDDRTAHADNDESASASSSSSSSSSVPKASKTTRSSSSVRNNTNSNFTTLLLNNNIEHQRRTLGIAFLPKYIQHQNSRKRSIHAIVTIVVVLAVPLVAFLYALVFRSNPQKTTNGKQQRRRERIVRGLNECRMFMPVTTSDDQQQRECPICLIAFTTGESVIASKHCRCNGTNTNAITNIGNNNNNNKPFPLKSHRMVFHEDCIVTWLSQRQTNPKKLCPCCRQPFFLSKKLRCKVA